MKIRPLFCSIILSVFFLLAQHQPLPAQCSNRYADSIFTQIDTTFNVIFTTTAGGSANTLLMDVYTPHGDTATNRRLIVWAHGGAFFEGTKNDNDMQFLCTNFANRGYVCASINYRLAPTIIDLYDSLVAFDYIIKATNDMKAAIRWFRQNAATGVNTYHIDTNYIYGGGSSAGAIMIDFASTIDSVSETPPYFQTVFNNNGGLDGNSGNPGYSSKVIAAASLAGAISIPEWIGPGNPPTIYSQGTADPIIPYDCSTVFEGYTLGLVPGLFHLCGSGVLEPQMASLGIPTSLVPFAGAGHVPWDTNQHVMNVADSAVAAFFYKVACPNGPEAAPSLNAEAQLIVYPNPASGALHIVFEDQNEIASFKLYDCTGRCIASQYGSGKQADLPLTGIAAGVYLLRIQLKDVTAGQVTKKVVVE